MVVGGNSQHVVQINLSDLARKEQMVIAVRKGTRDQLKRLIELVASGQVCLPLNIISLKSGSLRLITCIIPVTHIESVPIHPIALELSPHDLNAELMNFFIPCSMFLYLLIIVDVSGFYATL